MKTILLILGSETSEFARGEYNKGLFEAAREALAGRYELLTTVVEDGYDPAEEIAKFKRADAVLFQYPVYWFMMPSSLKAYVDRVYAYGEFFGGGAAAYGEGGLMTGKKFLLSTTWNAPADAFGEPGGFLEGATVDDVLFPMRKSQAFCGLEELPHFSCHDVFKSPRFAEDRARFLEHLSEVFGEGGTP